MISLYFVAPDGVCVRVHCVEVDVTVDVSVKVVVLLSMFVDTKASCEADSLFSMAFGGLAFAVDDNDAVVGAESSAPDFGFDSEIEPAPSVFGDVF